MDAQARGAVLGMDYIAAASTYVATILERLQARWPEIRQVLVSAYGRHPALADDDANYAEAALAALAVGLQALDQSAPPSLTSQLRPAVYDAVIDRFGTPEAATALDQYSELWDRTRDPSGLGMGFIMSVLGEEPKREGEHAILRYRTEKLAGGTLIDVAVGVWPEVLGGERGAGSGEREQ